MKNIFVVTRTSYAPCECGSYSSTSIEFVTYDEKMAKEFCRNENKKREYLFWGCDFDIIETEVK